MLDELSLRTPTRSTVSSSSNMREIEQKAENLISATEAGKDVAIAGAAIVVIVLLAKRFFNRWMGLFSFIIMKMAMQRRESMKQSSILRQVVSYCRGLTLLFEKMALLFENNHTALFLFQNMLLTRLKPFIEEIKQIINQVEDSRSRTKQWKDDITAGTIDGIALYFNRWMGFLWQLFNITNIAIQHCKSMETFNMRRKKISHHHDVIEGMTDIINLRLDIQKKEHELKIKKQELQRFEIEQKNRLEEVENKGGCYYQFPKFVNENSQKLSIGVSTLCAASYFCSKGLIKLK